MWLLILGVHMHPVDPPAYTTVIIIIIINQVLINTVWYIGNGNLTINQINRGGADVIGQ